MTYAYENYDGEIRFFREVTDWSKAPYEVPNHTYMLDEKKEFCFGYIKFTTDQNSVRPYIWFEKKKPFSLTRRKFEEMRSM